MPLLVAIFALFASQAELLPVQKFLQNSTSMTLPHPLQPQLQNHYDLVNPGQTTAVVFLPGMGESSLKYYDLFENLKLNNTTYYGWDHIGQGFSSHLLPDENIKVHIDSFETHLTALQSFFKKIRPQHKKIFIIAHSMGAHLALRLALENPGLIDALALSAPLFEIHPNLKTGTFLTWVLSLYPESSYPPLYSFFVKRNMNAGFVTNSVQRQNEFQKTLSLYPNIKRQGATVGWIRSARESIEKLKESNIQSLAIPVLILQADTDYLVDNSAQNEGCKKIPLCRIDVMKNSKHEILFEVDAVRSLALEKIRLFITSLSETNTAANL